MCEEIDKVIKEALSKYMSWENILKGQNNIKITRLWWIMQSVFFFKFNMQETLKRKSVINKMEIGALY